MLYQKNKYKIEIKRQEIINNLCTIMYGTNDIYLYLPRLHAIANAAATCPFDHMPFHIVERDT